MSAATFGLVLALALAGCGGPTPKKAARERDRAASTATSARMIATAWDSGAAPGVYASHAVGEMGASLAQAESSAVWSALPAGQDSTVRRELHALATITAQLDTAIRRNDRTAVADLHGSLLDHGRTLAGTPIDTAR
jgi:hypothetical protein